MGRICDPGQCPTNYWVEASYRVLEPNSPPPQYYKTYKAVKVLPSQSQQDYDRINFRITYEQAPQLLGLITYFGLDTSINKIRATNSNGVSVIIDSGTYFVGVVRTSPEVATQVLSFALSRVDGQPDRCNCRCESTDFTVTCAGLEGDICCIAKQTIFDMCSRLK